MKYMYSYGRQREETGRLARSQCICMYVNIDRIRRNAYREEHRRTICVTNIRGESYGQLISIPTTLRLASFDTSLSADTFQVSSFFPLCSSFSRHFSLFFILSFSLSFYLQRLCIPLIGYVQQGVVDQGTHEENRFYTVTRNDHENSR